MSAGPSAAAADSTRSSASSADEPLGDSLTSRSGWLKKKPTSHEKKAWRDAGVQKRFYVSRGLRVEYYDRAPVGEQAGKLKPRGTFDLRNVTSLRPAQHILFEDSTTHHSVGINLDKSIMGFSPLLQQ